MSEQSGFPFGEVSDGAGLDIDAIFGGASGGSGSVNPFESALTQQPAPIPQEAPQTIAPQPVPQAVQQPAPSVFQNVQPIPPAPVPAAQPAPAPRACGGPGSPAPIGYRPPGRRYGGAGGQD